MQGSSMWKRKSDAVIQHILCPSDLSAKSQEVLGFATRLAETLHARLTACHCAPVNWFTSENRLPKEECDRMKRVIKDRITQCQGPLSSLAWQSVIIENSFNPARDIRNFAQECEVDLIVMKARPG